MRQPQIGDIYTPVNSTRFGDVEVLSDGVEPYGMILHKVRFVRSGVIVDDFCLVDGGVEFVLKQAASLENE